jgi:hypothetical protein
MIFNLYRLSLFALFLLVVGTSNAATTYQYNGNYFDTVTDNDPPAGTYTTAMRASGSFTLSAPLSPLLNFTDISSQILDFSFNDGRQTLTDSTPYIDFEFLIRTNLDGDITAWDITLNERFGPEPHSIGQQIGTIRTHKPSVGTLSFDLGDRAECLNIISTGDPRCQSIQSDRGVSNSAPGSWTVVPVPPAVWLFNTGLLGLIGMARRKRLS